MVNAADKGAGRGREAHSPDVQVEDPLHSGETLGQTEHSVQGQAVLTEAGEAQEWCWHGSPRTSNTLFIVRAQGRGGLPPSPNDETH